MRIEAGAACGAVGKHVYVDVRGEVTGSPVLRIRAVIWMLKEACGMCCGENRCATGGESEVDVVGYCL